MSFLLYYGINNYILSEMSKYDENNNLSVLKRFTSLILIFKTFFLTHSKIHSKILVNNYFEGK